jgi:hypothetical protein
MQEALLRESALKQRIPGITHGIKQVIEHAAIEAIESGVERISMPLLWSWRNMFEPLASTRRRMASTIPRTT